MLDEIGTIAGEIWQYLNENEEASVGKLTQELKHTDRMILLGLGWLAREGQLNIVKRQRATYFLLNSTPSSGNEGSSS
ncbi:MAG: winged helix-turn-helix domain-containing protein [Candidatus Poribacteria bacterium]|nr:winged helix-turn-helix domain-containing protein [Candidatus Poribacteria bacterium]